MSRPNRFRLELGTADDAATLASLHTAVAEDLTRLHGRGAWSMKTSEKGVLCAMRTAGVFVDVREVYAFLFCTRVSEKLSQDTNRPTRSGRCEPA